MIKFKPNLMGTPGFADVSDEAKYLEEAKKIIDEDHLKPSHFSPGQYHWSRVSHVTGRRTKEAKEKKGTLYGPRKKG
jgi:hypothetical protein